MRDDGDLELLSIGELAERVGVATSALRYYDELGLLQPAGRHSGRRRYERSAIEAVGAILLLRDVGFTLGEIAEVRSSRSDPSARRSLLDAKLGELARKADEIAVAREALRHALDCPAPDIMTCPNFEAVVRERLAARSPWTRSVADARRADRRLTGRGRAAL